MTGHVAPDEHLDHVRAVLGNRYHVESEIGRGGAARVYLADPADGGDPVAIKVLRDELAAAVARDRFRLEIAVTKTLKHPNILPILASDEVQGLLYYVAPFVRGESLRQRLSRERQLSLAEAIRIARAIAAGLAEAHRQGIVHRDIKPENILLEGDRVLVADFGIARAITAAAGDRLTSTGVAIGTPGYMSPEQATGDADIDHRCDIYALGCVLYEMLAGEGPYTGPSAQVIVAKQISLPTPSLRTIRDAVPRGIDRAVRRALEKVPADRFASVEEFAAALTVTDAGPTLAESIASIARRPVAWLATGVTAAVIGAFFLTHPGIRSGGNAADTTRYLIVAGPSAAGTLRDALQRWNGVSAVDAARLTDALRDEVLPLPPERAAILARRLGAGRVLQSSVSPAGDSARVTVSLYDAGGNGTLLAERAFYVVEGDRRQDSLFTSAVDKVLFRGMPPADAPDSTTTRSLPGRQAFGEGKRALAQWDLPGADSAFSKALRYDGEYAQAALWLAVTRAWSGAAPARWRLVAQQAVLRQERLTATDRGIALAVAAEGDSDWAVACPYWQRGAERDTKAFELWYGLARCLANDDAVLRDSRSPSGWRFRTSYDVALRAYQSAFDRDPALLASLQPHSFEWLRFLFMTAGNRILGGRAVAPDTLHFMADPELHGEVVAFVPFPQGSPRPRPPTKDAAVHELRVRFRDVATAWATADPRSVPALEALAIGMAMLGDNTALDTLQRARALAIHPADRFRLANSEIWMRLGLSVPSDPVGLTRVRQLADSLLDAPPDANADPGSLASLAALTGRAGRAARYAVAAHRLEATEEAPELRDGGPALLMYSALGGPAESLRVLEPIVRRAIETLSPSARFSARVNWLILPASLTYPEYQFESLRELAAEDPILRLAWSAAQGDSGAVRRGLQRQQRQARGVSPSAFTFDGLLPLAALEVWVGAPREGAAWLDAPLAALGQKAPDVLASPPGVACLVRAMALRAEIADRLHDRDGARRWARAVVTLWSGADGFLQTLLTRQQHLAR